MSYVITGGLDIGRDRSTDNLIVERWNHGGEVRYTITGGGLQDGKFVWVARFRRRDRSLQITYRREVAGFPDAVEILANAFKLASIEDRMLQRLKRFFVSYDATNYQRWNIASTATVAVAS